tara:strand:+ start:72 stop:686 length:615 start_codon:yes stop_codon:yes gene_type:complete
MKEDIKETINEENESVTRITKRTYTKEEWQDKVDAAMSEDQMRSIEQQVFTKENVLETTGMSEEELMTQGVSIGAKAKMLLQHNPKHNKEFVELKLRIQPIVLLRMIEDEMVAEWQADGKGALYNPKKESDAHNTWGEKNSLSGDSKWIWDWILEALKGGKDSIDFYYDDDTVYGPASVDWLPLEGNEDEGLEFDETYTVKSDD